MPRNTEGRVSLFCCERQGRGLLETIISSKAVPEVFDVRYKSELKHGFTNPEAVARRCLVKQVFLKISQNSHENTCT